MSAHKRWHIRIYCLLIYICLPTSLANITYKRRQSCRPLLLQQIHDWSSSKNDRVCFSPIPTLWTSQHYSQEFQHFRHVYLTGLLSIHPKSLQARPKQRYGDKRGNMQITVSRNRSTLIGMPPELLLEIVGNLGPADKASLALTCKSKWINFRPE